MIDTRSTHNGRASTECAPAKGALAASRSASRTAAVGHHYAFKCGRQQPPRRLPLPWRSTQPGVLQFRCIFACSNMNWLRQAMFGRAHRQDASAWAGMLSGQMQRDHCSDWRARPIPPCSEAGGAAERLGGRHRALEPYTAEFGPPKKGWAWSAAIQTGPAGTARRPQSVG